MTFKAGALPLTEVANTVHTFVNEGASPNPGMAPLFMGDADVPPTFSVSACLDGIHIVHGCITWTQGGVERVLFTSQDLDGGWKLDDRQNLEINLGPAMGMDDVTFSFGDHLIGEAEASRYGKTTLDDVKEIVELERKLDTPDDGIHTGFYL